MLIQDHSPRSAAVLLARALTNLSVIDPPGLREPVGLMLRAGIELCAATTSGSLFGAPIEHTLALAEAIMSEVERRAAERPI